MSAIHDLEYGLVGKDPLNTELLWHDNYRDAYWRGGPVFMSALAAVDQALWDLKGKYLGCPVWQLLGGKVRDKVPCYANGWFSRKGQAGSLEPEEFAACAEEEIANMHWKGLKWDPFGSAWRQLTLPELKRALRCVEKVKEVVGDKCDILIECHGRFDLPCALELSRQLADGESPDSEDSDRDNGEPSEDGSEEGSESEEDGGMTPAQALRSAMEEMEVSPEDLDSAEADFESAMRAIESEESETKEDHAVNLDFPVKGGYKKGCSSATCRNIKVKVNPSDRDALALEYEKIVNPMRSMINHLANQLKRILRNDRSEKVYKTSGKISIERLSSGKLTAYMFTKRREPHNKCDADIFILCDESGSMDWGNKSRLCRAAAIALAEALRNLGISLHIVGFTADEGADADHFHYMNGNNTRDTRLALMNISARSNNYDGYSIRYATEYLKKRPSAHKLLIVISDGQPACSRYYSGDDGVRDTAMAIKDASKYFPVVGILIGNENPETHRKMYGYNFIHISNPNDLFSGLAKTIAKQIKNW